MTKNETAAGAAKTADREIFLSEILSLPVMLKGKKIGALSDLIIVETTLIPEVKSLYVKRSFGYPSLIIPWENIQGARGTPDRYRYPGS